MATKAELDSVVGEVAGSVSGLAVALNAMITRFEGMTTIDLTDTITALTNIRNDVNALIALVESKAL